MDFRQRDLSLRINGIWILRELFDEVGPKLYSLFDPELFNFLTIVGIHLEKGVLVSHSSSRLINNSVYPIQEMLVVPNRTRDKVRKKLLPQ